MADALDHTLPDPWHLRQGIARFPGTFADPAHGLLEHLRGELQRGRAGVRRQFEAGGGAEFVTRELTRQTDALVQGVLDFGLGRLYGSANPTTGEELAVIAVGGYGRAELAPGSDIDLLFLCHYKRTPHVEQMAEFLLYKLWDLGLKVGQSVRSVAECVKLAQRDLTVRTALLEARYLWGSSPLYAQLVKSFEKDVIANRGPSFAEAKLAERDARHQRMGDSRFLLEPNVKEGKGGLRDLQTLVWIGRFLYRSEDVGELVRQSVLTRQALGTFARARRFLWTVRCHLHYLTGRAEDRLTFDLQPEIARRMGYRERNKVRAVERFMKRYYLVARDVGTVTRIFCAALDERQHRTRPFTMPRFGFGQRRVNGFVVQGNRLNLGEPGLFAREPGRMLELFHIAQARDLDIHPQALASVTHELGRIDGRVRASPEANRLFLEILCSRHDPALALLRMNESGLLGRFVPEFGRIVAQTQHNLYHVYTVDEHTIRAIGILAQIEAGELAGELPLSTELMPKLQSRRELYVATFLHDTAKGRGGDHSLLGEGIAKRLGPRFGLSDASTETVAWLVRHHLLMSRFAFKRDLDDPQTVGDFVAVVQSPERLKLLLLLTAIDIRAVGPTVWNGWKGQLLRELYDEAAAAMATGNPQGRRAQRIGLAKDKLAEALAREPDGGWPENLVGAYLARHDPRYWLGFTIEAHLRHAQVVRQADAERAPLALDFRVDTFRARTEILLYAADHPGLFMKLAGALALSGVSIVDAHIFTTADGMALDALGFQDAGLRAAVEDRVRLERIRENIVKALSGEIWLERALEGRRSLPARADVFQVEPRVLIDNSASRTHSVIEVNGRDRPGLLFGLAKTLKDLGLVIHSAHVSTYGERVVDVFYVKDVFGLKIAHRAKMQRVQKGLAEVLQNSVSVGRAALTVGGLTACSRVAGLGRDLLIAAALGAGPVADAFFVALKLANFLRRLFAEGAFSAAFVPLYGRVAAAGGAPAAKRFAGEALAVLATALILVVVLAELAMPALVRGLAPGFVPGSERFALAVELGRVTFPYLLAASLAALVAAMLQAGHRFAAAAAAPILMNLVLIAVLLATGAVGADAARLLAWGVAVAGLAQLAWVLVAAAGAGVAPAPAWPRLSPEVRRLARLIGPGLLGVGVVQVNTLVASWFASRLPEGAVAHLFYADRLVQLPLGVVGAALGTALLPSLSDAVRRGQAGTSALNGALNRALELALLLGVPAAAGLVLLAEPIIAVLFERGAFDAAATWATAGMLAMLALGVPAQILGRVLASGFFALEDTATPVRIAALAVAVNVALAALLGASVGGPGIALAGALASWVGTGMMAVLLARRGVLAADAGLRRRAAGILAATAAMTCVLLLAGTATGAVALAGLIALGGGTFLLAAWVAGGLDPTVWRSAGRA